MLGKISHSALPVDVTRTLGEIYLEQARAQKKLENLDVALPLYDQVKETLKLHGSVKEALRKAQDPQALADETLRAMMADAYFERGEVLEGLSFFDKAQASYLKAKKWGYAGAKHRAEASQSPPLGHSTHSSRPTLAQAAMLTSMPSQQLAASSAEEKSALVDYLFEKALLTLSSLEVPDKPSLFLVYAHDNPTHGKADAETSKYLIEKLFQIQGFKLHSDQAPMGRPYSCSPEELKKDGKLGDIVTNQLCLLPAQLIKEVKPVDKVVVCSSEVLGSYLKWKDYEKFHQELRDAYHKDLAAYRNDNEQKDALAIRQVVNKFSQEEDYKAEFHHVLTEIAFLQIREKHMIGEHGIIPVSLTPNSYEKCLAHFIPATTVRMEDIPRLEGQAQAGREVHQNQSRHGVLFKLIERLLVGSNEAKTFLDKFWNGHGECISLLNKNSTLDALQFAQLLDGIFDGIQRAQHTQLASILNQQDQELWILKADPIDALKGQYFAALTQNEAFQETLKLYVEPRCRASLDGESKTFELLPQVQAFLNDKKVILLTGDSGAGKTTFNRRLEKHLWEHKKEDDAIPLFISLPSIEKPEQDLIAKALKKRGLSEFQIQKLKKEKFVFILDGYDEIRQTQNLYVSNAINQSDGWQGKMVISCRSEYLGQDYQSRFQPNPTLKDKDTLFQEVVVLPFSKEESDQYLEKYVEHHPTSWTAQAYQESFSKQSNLKDLISNPFLLRVVLEALPYVEKKGKVGSAIQLRMDLYDQFVRQWFERNQQRLGAQSLTGNQKEVFRELYDDGFAQHGIGFVKELAVHLYKENAGNPIVEYSLFKDKGSWKDAFFGREEENQLLREAWPLIRNGTEYRFIHKSLLEYFVVRALFESFDACMVVSTRQRRDSAGSAYSFEEHAVLPSKTLRDLSLSPKHWIGDLGVVRLLTDRVQQESPFKEQLLAIIERSKADKTVRQTAANAITILVRAGVRFNGMDLKGVQIPGADLSGGEFDYAQLQGADLRKTKLRNIWLRNANLSGAQMAGVQFDEWPLLQEDSQVIDCTYSPDGKTYVAGLIDGTISVYDTLKWTKIYTLNGHTGPVMSVAYSPDGQQIASGGDDCAMFIWDVRSGQLIHTLSGHNHQVSHVAYSPNGQQIASGCGDGTLRLWDARSGQLSYALNAHIYLMRAMAYSPDGKQIASSSDDRTVKLWDTQAGELRHTLSGHTNGVWRVAYSPDGQQIASGDYDGTVRSWDVQSGKLKYTLNGHTNSVQSVVYSPNGQQIASSSNDNTVRLWDAQSGQLNHTLNEHNSYVSQVTYSPNGQQIAFASEGTVQLRDAQSGQLCRTLSRQGQYVCHVLYSPNGQQIASSNEDVTAIHLWDAQSGQLKHTLHGHPDLPITSVAYSPNGQQIAFGSRDTTVLLWDAQSGQLCHTLREHTSWLESLVYSPNGQQIASSSQDAIVLLWDAQSGQLSYTLREEESRLISRPVYSPNGKQIAFGRGDNLQLWDTQSGQLSLNLIGHTRDIYSAAYSPSGQQIASGSDDHTVRLWDVASGQCQEVIQDFQGGVTSIAWKTAPNGNYLVTGCQDKSVRLWQVMEETGQYQVRLCWSSTHAALALTDASIQEVNGLSQVNKQLLKQRGAVE